MTTQTAKNLCFPASLREAIIAITLSAISLLNAQQINIPRIDQMPNFPQPYEMRDWKKVAHDFDALVFNPDAKGLHLPLVKIVEGPNKAKAPIFALPTFVGWNNPNSYEAIACLGAINGASVAGIDKRQGPNNWVDLSTNFFNDHENIQMVLNSATDQTGDTFWYELLPNIIFYRIYDRYPDTPGMKAQLITIANRWHEACLGMGGKTSPYTIPNFDHTSYHFKSGTVKNNGLWKEGGSAAAIAWIGYMAHQITSDQKHLTTAKWGLDYLEQCNESPFYEALLPHGAYLAARMNAEHGTHYDVKKLVNWCFDGNNHRGWGESLGKWGHLDCAGLAGACSGKHDADGIDGKGYAFAKNTFNKANSLVPLVRYDDRFAHAIGKWMLNAANSARLYYANGLPPTHQSDHHWAKQYDPTSCLAYEGLKDKQISLGRIKGDHQSLSGTAIHNTTWKDTHFTNKTGHTFQGPDIEHIWEVEISDAESHQLNILCETKSDQKTTTFTIAYAQKPDGPYTTATTFQANERRPRSAPLQLTGNTLYLKITTKNATPSTTISTDDVWIKSTGKHKPYATGDAKESGWAETNFGLYGSAFVGLFGGLIETTDVEGILKLNLLATDYFHKKAHPTHLYYNPHPEKKDITITPSSKTPVNFYDTTTNTYAAKNITQNTKISLSPDTAIILVEVPTNQKLIQKKGTTYLKNTPIDFSYKPPK